MKKRMAALAAAAALAATAVPAANGQQQVEGLYRQLPAPQPTLDPDKVEVVEVFWYGCPHCNRFQPALESWLRRKPEHVHFVRMPAIFSEQGKVHARAWYTALALGVADDIHPRIFDAIHRQGRRLATWDAVRELFLEHGVDADDFDRHARSFTVEAGLQRSLAMQTRYGVRGVPSIVVNGKYLVSGTTVGGGTARKVLEVVDALVAREHAAAGG